MVSKNAEAGRGRHPAPAPNFALPDKPEYKLAPPAKQANLLAKCFGRTPLKISTRALHPRAARSKIVRLGRVFRARLEILHKQCGSSDDWEFAFELVSEQGRRFLGTYGDVALAFAVALAWRNQGVRIVCVGRGQP
jgi:hypothetical protein